LLNERRECDADRLAHATGTSRRLGAQHEALVVLIDGDRFQKVGGVAKVGPISTRERILTSAERLFAEHGFDGVTMPMVAAASAITAGAVYKHFDRKSDLFFKVVQRVVQSVAVAAAERESNATLLPRIVATYTTQKLTLLRQLAVEIHYASVKHAKVCQVLRSSPGPQYRANPRGRGGHAAGRQTRPECRSSIPGMQRHVFCHGVDAYGDSLAHLVDDPKWYRFVQDRVVALIGISDARSHGPWEKNDHREQLSSNRRA
jgi:AcrR family transcriptional regulator